MTKKRIIWIVVIVIVVVLLALPKIMPKQPKNVTSRAAGKGAPIKVTVFVTKKENLEENIQVAGNIIAMEAVDLRSETQGRVVKIFFDEGSEVKKGQLLVKINDADLKAQLKKAIATQALKEETEKRNKQLLAKGAISQETYDLSATEVNTINADIDMVKEQIRRTEIVAPFDGLIGLRYISEGSYVTNASQVASLQSINQVKIEFSIPEKYASKIRKGSDITFSIDGNDETFKAKVYAIEPKIDPSTRNVMMRAICSNQSRKLLPGGFARVSVGIADNPHALNIPTQSVVPILKGQKVYIVKGDSAVERVIRTGIRGDVSIEVTEGLNPGDSVIVDGVIYIKPGSKVKVVKDLEPSVK